MDYLTRRSIAANGALGIRIPGVQAKCWPHLSALGVRVEVEGAVVCIEELQQALTDIGEQVELPAAKQATADSLESLLVKFDPADLHRRIKAFLERLSEEAERRVYLIRSLPLQYQEPFRRYLGQDVIHVEGGEEGYRPVDLRTWLMDEV